MIKRFCDLNTNEKIEVCNFISRDLNNNMTLTEIEVMFNNKMYGYGQGSLFYFLNRKVIGRIGVVLEYCSKLETIYIHSIDVLENLNYKEKVIENLIDKAINIANEYNPKKLKLGIRTNEILKITKNLGFNNYYKVLNMQLTDKVIKEKTLELIQLTTKNRKEYLNIFNDSFSDMPHGTYLDIEDIDKYINDVDNNNFFMVCDNNKILGFMNTEIKNNIGMFDIGLCKKYRGKGYGKKLLDTAIDFLNKKSVDKIELYVVETNELAYNMYKKRGFKEKSILSYWTNIK